MLLEQCRWKEPVELQIGLWVRTHTEVGFHVVAPRLLQTQAEYIEYAVGVVPTLDASWKPNKVDVGQQWV